MTIFAFLSDPRFVAFWNLFYVFLGRLILYGAIGFFIATYRNNRHWEKNGDKIAKGIIEKKKERIEELMIQLSAETTRREDAEATIRAFVGVGANWLGRYGRNDE